MAFFQNNFWGEKNAGFDVLYHNMKHGQLATKELAEFVRERAAIEETYSKSMSKLSKMAINGSPQGTFAPMWDVFRVSSDKLALCHLELMRKMNDLIRDISKYGDEQVKIHRKTKEEMVGTVEAVQALQVHSGHLQKSKEGYHSKCLELDRLRKDGGPQKELEKAELKSKKAAESFALSIEKYNRVGGEFEQKMSESAQRFQEIEEAHLRQMKQLIKGYSHSIEDTHVQVGQVHEEFKQNVENIGIDNLIQKFAEQKGTGKDRPALAGFEEYMTALAPEGGKKGRAKTFRIPGLGKRDKEPDSTDSAVTETANSPLEVDDEGFVIRADSTHNDILFSALTRSEKDNNFYSSDSDFDDDEPKKFHIQIRPVASSGRSSSAATEKELKATVGALTLPPNRGVTIKRHISNVEQDGLCRSTSSPDHSRLSSTASGSDSLFGPPLESAFKSKSFDGREQLRERSTFGASEYAAFSSDSSSPENVEDSGLDSPSHQPLGPSPEPVGWAAWPPVSQSKDQSQTLGRPVDPFLSVFRDPSPGRSTQSQGDPASVWSIGPSRPSRLHSDMDPSKDTSEEVAAAPQRATRAKRTSGRITGCERSRSLCSSPLPEPSPSLTTSSSSSSPMHLSRGPSPISLSTQEAWPVAAAITEYINAYFKGGQHNRCLVKITGDLTMSFPAGITRIFTANPNVPVLSFRLVNMSRIDHFLPNQKLLYSDPSQSDPDTRDFWFNMQALQIHLQREAELNPQASYYNAGLLKYQVSSQDPGRAPLLLSAECQRSGTVTRVSLDYHCCPATAPSTQLTAVQVLLPLDHNATDLQCQPPASWNAEERRLLWKLPNLSPTNHSKGSGTLCASWQCLEVPRGPPPSLAVQFVGSGASLSGMDVELVGSRYRMSLVKKRFATGKYMAGCSL
ncbi:F-BAR domain only protein 1 [Scophthalmus maximus]|uniref:F-BAR domain only protein 1 n=1 Tax=Scophthalmus maximus TaxID=52904 RepID=A0A2U9C276_SCOMX|nr:F-BAR domain only protein 1 [Scophthalmus maximus]